MWFYTPSLVQFEEVFEAMKTKLLLMFIKIRKFIKCSQNSQISVWKPNFFLSKL